MTFCSKISPYGFFIHNDFCLSAINFLIFYLSLLGQERHSSLINRRSHFCFQDEGNYHDGANKISNHSKCESPYSKFLLFLNLLIPLQKPCDILQKFDISQYLLWESLYLLGRMELKKQDWKRFSYDYLLLVDNCSRTIETQSCKAQS